MKKLILAAALLAATGVASAYDLGLRGGRNAQAGMDTVGVTFGMPVYQSLSLEASADRASAKNVNQFGVTGVLSAPVGPLSFSARAGGVYARTATQEGYAWRYGVGADYALTKNLILGVTAERLDGQKRLEQLNGTVLQAGVKYRF